MTPEPAADDKLDLPEPPPPEGGADELAAPAADTPPDDRTCPKCGKRLGSSRGRANHERTCTGPQGDTAPKRPVGRPPKPKLGEKLEGMIGGIGLAVSAFNLYDGQCVIAGAPDLASALEGWASENPAVRQTLERLVEATTAGAVILAATKIAIPIAANHGFIPADMAQLAGVSPPPSPAATNGATG